MIETVYASVARVVEEMPARAAFDAATALAEAVRGLAEAAAGLRARMAARVARERTGEPLSVRALADVLGVSPSKAGELVTRAARAERDARARAPRPPGAGDAARGTDG